MVPGRLYTVKEGKMHEASSLSGGEALRMAHLLTKGHDKVTELRAKRQQECSTTKGREGGYER